MTPRPDGTGSAIRILIVATSALFAETVARELRLGGGCHVLGYVDASEPCTLAVSAAAPDVVLIDDAGTPAQVLASVSGARDGAPGAKLLLVTTRMDQAWLAEASAAGIDGAIAKSVGPARLGLLVKDVVAGNVFNAIAPPVRAAVVPVEDTGLTGRELEILRLVAAGGSNSSIARHLWVAEQTVKFHLSNIYRKLGVTNRTEASHFAHVHGLLEPSAPGAVPIDRAA
jgi:DNA-binding NarL/FixJ family response regulator